MQNGAHELLNTLGAGLGYRSMFHLPIDELAVNVYQDLKHLPPQPKPVAYRFPYPIRKRFGGIPDLRGLVSGIGKVTRAGSDEPRDVT